MAVNVLYIKFIDDGFYGNVTGQIPVRDRPFSPRIHMAQQAVEYHVKKSPVNQDPPPFIHTHQMLRLVIDEKSIRCHSAPCAVRQKS